MKILKIILSIVLAVVALFFLIGFFLPKSYDVNRTITINAPDSVIYKNIADFNEFLKWNPWSKMEPNQKTTITGTPATPGHLWEWEGKETGQGQMKILSVAPNTDVDIELKFIKPFESLADTKFNIKPQGEGQLVTWSMSGTSDGIMSRWMGLMMDSMIGKDFESGLISLKEKSEAK